MKRFIKCLSIGLLALLLADCIPDETVGTYESKSGSTLVVRKDGRVSWSSDPEATEGVLSLGIVDINKKKKSGYLVMHSASRWIGTNFKYDKNYEKIWVEWIRIDGEEVENRDIEYTKKK